MASVPSPNRLFYDVLGPGQARGSSSPPGQHGCFPPLEDSMGAFRNMPPYNTPSIKRTPPQMTLSCHAPTATKGLAMAAAPRDIVMLRAHREHKELAMPAQ